MAQDIINRFLRALGKMSSRELYELAAVLRSDAKRTDAIEIITRLAGLKGGPEANRPSVKSTPAIPSSGQLTEAKEETVLRGRSVRSSFFALMGDKSCFEDNEEIISAIRDAFGVETIKSNNAKETRERLIARAWREIRKLPARELERSLRSLCKRHNHLEGRDTYKELFRILSKGE